MTKKSKSIIVTVDDGALAGIDALAKKLAAKGMTVDTVLPITGVISGTCPATKLAALKAVAGVLGVEEELTIHLSPPDAALQ